jgi:hypothetical protein
LIPAREIYRLNIPPRGSDLINLYNYDRAFLLLIRLYNTECR